jgi:hypothetical protein
VPAQAMHFRKPRRSMPSGLISLLLEFETMGGETFSRSVELLMVAPRGTCVVHLRELSQSIFIPLGSQKRIDPHSAEHENRNARPADLALPRT